MENPQTWTKEHHAICGALERHHNDCLEGIIGGSNIDYIYRELLASRFLHKETQDSVYDWTKEVFPEFNSQHARVVAILEEAIELAVAAKIPIDTIQNTVMVSLAKSLRQKEHDDKEEAGDLLSCVYAYAGQQGFDLHEQLDKKMAFNRTRPIEYYRAKTAAKQKAGMQIQIGLVSGAEIRAFWEEGWPEGYYYETEDSSTITDPHDEDGNWALVDEKTYDLSKFGELWPDPDSSGPTLPFEEAFNKWKSQRAQVVEMAEPSGL